MFALPPTIAVITQPTRLQGLVARWSTRNAARFHVKQAVVQERARQPLTSKRRAGRAAQSNAALAAGIKAGEAAFAEYEQEDLAQRQSLDRLKTELDLGYPLKFVERQYLPTFDFRGCVAVVVVGQDGLVANTAKYVGDVPIVAVNPDPTRIDGVLLPFQVHQARQAVKRTVENRRKGSPSDPGERKPQRWAAHAGVQRRFCRVPHPCVRPIRLRIGKSCRATVCPAG